MPPSAEGGYFYAGNVSRIRSLTNQMKFDKEDAGESSDGVQGNLTTSIEFILTM